MTELDFFVPGIPAPQGSKSAYVRGGRAVIVEGSSKTGRANHRAWRAAVTLEAIAARTIDDDGTMTDTLDCPVSIHVRFVMPRPKSAKKGATWAATKPDLDKLMRSTLDGLADAGVFTDDSRVAGIIASKTLTDDGVTGAHIIVGPL